MVRALEPADPGFKFSKSHWCRQKKHSIIFFINTNHLAGQEAVPPPQSRINQKQKQRRC